MCVVSVWVCQLSVKLYWQLTHAHTHTSSAISDKWNLSSLYIKHSGASPTGGWGRGPDPALLKTGRFGPQVLESSGQKPVFFPIFRLFWGRLATLLMIWPPHSKIRGDTPENTGSQAANRETLGCVIAAPHSPVHFLKHCHFLVLHVVSFFNEKELI